MISGLTSSITSGVTSTLQSLTQTTSSSTEAEKSTDPVAQAAASSSEPASTPSNDTTVAASSNTSKSEAGGSSTAQTQSVAARNAAAAASMQVEAEATAKMSDLARSRAEALATQDRLRQTTLVATISEGGSQAPKIAPVEASPSTANAATSYSAANKPAEPAAALAELRA